MFFRLNFFQVFFYFCFVFRIKKSVFLLKINFIPAQFLINRRFSKNRRFLENKRSDFLCPYPFRFF
ncbi:MAG TPA: hypothetical protein DHW82_12610 [Spirochaetia bacterium]|nr:hypothetical protein [Spirochaetia bacterium]